MAKVTVDGQKCTGCKACELGCSFHHKKLYNPEESAIHIFMEDTEGIIEVSWNKAKCDGCANEAQGPQCLYYCKPAALTVG